MPLHWLSNHPHGIVKLNNLTADLRELCGDCLQVLGDHIAYHHISPGCRCRTHKGARLDLVRDNGILRAVQMIHSPDTDGIRACSLDVCTHAVQKVSYIYNMRLLGRIFKDCLSLCQGSCHHNINGSAYRNHIKIDMAGHQVDRMGKHRSPLDHYLCSQCPKSLDMLVNGPAADVASAGKRNLSTFVFTQKRSDKIIRSSNSADEFIIHGNLLDIAAINPHRVAVHPLHPRANLLDSLKHHIDILHIWEIVNQDILIRHNGGCQNPQRRILCTAHGYISYQGIAALYDILFHSTPLNLYLYSLYPQGT